MSENPQPANIKRDIKKYLNTPDKSGITLKFSKEKIHQVSGFYSEESERKTVADKIKQSRIQEKKDKEISQEILKNQPHIEILKPKFEALKARWRLLETQHCELESLEVSLLSKLRNRKKIKEL